MKYIGLDANYRPPVKPQAIKEPRPTHRELELYQAAVSGLGAFFMVSYLAWAMS